MRGKASASPEGLRLVEASLFFHVEEDSAGGLA
jgi:hypothetical protein